MVPQKLNFEAEFHCDAVEIGFSSGPSPFLASVLTQVRGRCRIAGSSLALPKSLSGSTRSRVPGRSRLRVRQDGGLRVESAAEAPS